jgi:hypothetical protein
MEIKSMDVPHRTLTWQIGQKNDETYQVDEAIVSNVSKGLISKEMGVRRWARRQRSYTEWIDFLPRNFLIGSKSFWQRLGYDE